MNRFKAWFWCYWNCSMIKTIPQPAHWPECPRVHPELWQKAADQHMAKHE